MRTASRLTLCTLALTASNTLLATEGGGTVYPVGAENYTCCALPPPGMYGIVYAQSYSADTLRNNKGDDASPSDDFKVTANAVVPRLVYVTEQQVLGGSLGFHTIAPLVNLDVKIAPGVSDSDSGLGDMVFGAAIGWHHSQALHTVAVFDIIAPTGSYDKTEIANIGRNHWAAQGVYGVSRMDPTGLNFGFKGMWTVNGENSDTHYTDGQELIMDYALGWGIGNGLVVGAGGYLYQQITDDEQNGATIKDNRGKAMAIGPSIRFDSGKGWFATVKYTQEMNVRNRAEGNTLWLKAVMPL
ncbi:SphA family protein [Parathalassolituus penaei]|uniref:Transporter n=1 Tax=Parathalassolituus penaei TaxID=2997323 RepID=A0A9X3EDW1_9GAMM|nr:transporter [Parathalassolituus penaei]MCY0965396.1 transporter [Parathalassolituus penaei]